MDDTIEKRVDDVEQMLAHLPQDLDVRFAGADARAGARFDQLSIRTHVIENRVRQVEQAVANIAARLDMIEARVDARFEGLETRVDAGFKEVLGRLAPKA